MSYRVEVRPAALRALRGVHPRERKGIQGAIALLAQNPRPPGASRMRGRDAYRIRVGDYRIITSGQEFLDGFVGEGVSWCGQ